MLDMSNSQLSFLKPTSRPDSSQSEAQRAFSLGSQEVLTAEGVRFRSQDNPRQADLQARSSEHGSSSSSLSEARDLDETYRSAANLEWEQSQSQEGAQDSQQQSQDVEPQSQQQSLGLSIFNDLAVGPHAFETPMKAGGRNLQGTGRKLTPRPESQPRQSKSGAIQPMMPKQPKGPAAPPRVQKKVSALDSGPRNFKIGGSGKGKSISFAVSDAEEEEDDEDQDGTYSAPGSSIRGSRSPQKRPAPQSPKTNKRQRTETATPVAGPTSQRSAAATPRRSQTSSTTPGPQRRRSSRTSKG